ncbi:hypothetical protein CXG81DRAFT_23500 [Caulochytrium protostelioides]|uniref:Uncharacterized protein n=1 Tax=Caulochytrium protostelioides TaxID=1555241 RepID=A0A4P9XEK5_9FUNG|nr:hypothetical protein CXG81DRAFT_23500 [Caulochytrium protostelioides]|eukprot:RKP03942.1 hypothetical protein CXG81DRAFT_23500 [Caulochytrium protostelioides]
MPALPATAPPLSGISAAMDAAAVASPAAAPLAATLSAAAQTDMPLAAAHPLVALVDELVGALDRSPLAPADRQRVALAAIRACETVIAHVMPLLDPTATATAATASVTPSIPRDLRRARLVLRCRWQLTALRITWTRDINAAKAQLALAAALLQQHPALAATEAAPWRWMRLRWLLWARGLKAVQPELRQWLAELEAEIDYGARQAPLMFGDGAANSAEAAIATPTSTTTSTMAWLMTLLLFKHALALHGATAQPTLAAPDPAGALEARTALSRLAARRWPSPRQPEARLAAALVALLDAEAALYAGTAAVAVDDAAAAAAASDETSAWTAAWHALRTTRCVLAVLAALRTGDMRRAQQNVAALQSAVAHTPPEAAAAAPSSALPLGHVRLPFGATDGDAVVVALVPPAHTHWLAFHLSGLVWKAADPAKAAKYFDRALAVAPTAGAPAPGWVQAAGAGRRRLPPHVAAQTPLECELLTRRHLVDLHLLRGRGADDDVVAACIQDQLAALRAAGVGCDDVDPGPIVRMAELQLRLQMVVWLVVAPPSAPSEGGLGGRLEPQEASDPPSQAADRSAAVAVKAEPALEIAAIEQSNWPSPMALFRALHHDLAEAAGEDTGDTGRTSDAVVAQRFEPYLRLATWLMRWPADNTPSRLGGASSPDRRVDEASSEAAYPAVPSFADTHVEETEDEVLRCGETEEDPSWPLDVVAEPVRACASHLATAIHALRRNAHRDAKRALLAALRLVEAHDLLQMRLLVLGLLCEMYAATRADEARAMAAACLQAARKARRESWEHAILNFVEAAFTTPETAHPQAPRGPATPS